MQSSLYRCDSLERPARNAEVSHSLDDWSLEATLNLIQEALLYILLLDTNLLDPLFIAKSLKAYISSCLRKFRGWPYFYDLYMGHMYF